jgi:nucleotide-binding universal stress UspA family protein
MHRSKDITPGAVIAATRFTPVCRAASERAAMLARSYGVPLVLAHVARSNGETATRLQREAARLGAAHRIRVDTLNPVGRPVVELASLAERLRPRLFVVGLGRGLVRVLGPSFAERLRHRITAPVLAVAQAPEGNYERVLLAVSLSGEAEPALRGFERHFPHAELHLLHVCPPGFEGRLPPGRPSAPQRRLHHERALRSTATELVRFAYRTGLGRALFAMRLGVPAKEIRLRAREVRADLMVLVPSERSWLASLLFGRVTGPLVSRPACDMLLLSPVTKRTASPPEALAPGARFSRDLSR